MWKLVIEDDEGKRTVVPLSRDDYTIGRQEGNTIRLTERNVSRTHGRVWRRQNGISQVFVVEDLRSYNGVFVNGLRVAHTQDLQHGDLIQIGDYRIVLQDDAASVLETAALPVARDPTDAKATQPVASAYRGQTLTERPNRLVMLVGPTPGVEYPLDRERLTVGRAEDANISVNHNSVSRLHCEIHALGDGRFEIVDKGSSNGVRVNAVELRRSIIEAGDVIELGDVRFKFVGAGQIFVPGPNESQQLTAISDRDAEIALSQRRGLVGYFVPVLGAGIVGAAIILAVAWALQSRAFRDPADAGITSVGDTEQALLLEAKKACTIDDCEQPHTIVSGFPETSPWKDHPDAKYVIATWAESLLRRARAESDPSARRTLLARLLSDPRVDPAQKKLATDLIEQAAAPVDSTPAPAPVPVATKDAGAVTMTPTTPRPLPTSHTTVTNATTAAPTASPAAAAPKPTTNTAVIDRAREAGLRGEYAAVRQLLEAKVRAGHGTAEEARLVKEACKGMQDRACSDDIRQKYP
jgi:ABC transport system ATP-binding/permease protein